MHLNKHRPYGHVVGLPGVVWTQDGHFFDGSGRVVADPEASSAPEEITENPRTEAASKVILVSEEITSITAKDDMRLKENRAIKFQWESFYPDEDFPGVAEARRKMGVTE